MSSRTILIVDDDADFRDNLIQVLQAAGYNALAAADGRTAAATIDNLQSSIDLMVVDLCLPDMNGIEIIQAVARKKTEIKIIAASGVFDDVFLDMATSLGADAGIRKPGGQTAAVKWLRAIRDLLGETPETAVKPLEQVVLLAEDEAPVRAFVKTILQREGYQVLEAADGRGAMALAHKMNFAIDLLVTDIKMPGMDGLALAQALKEVRPEIPVVYMSGFTDEAGSNALDRPSEGSVFICKPFLPRVLMDAVRALLPQAG